MDIFSSFWHWLLTVTGVIIPAGGSQWYNFWSGFGSDLGELVIIGSLYGLYRHHKCATCWRIGHHPVEGTPYKTCHKHATVDIHKQLHQQHKKQYPEQHALLNAGE